MTTPEPTNLLPDLAINKPSRYPLDSIRSGRDYQVELTPDVPPPSPQFVRVHQVLLNTVIGKHGILARTPFTAPIAAVLRTVEAGVDELAFGLIDLIPTCAARATQDKQALDQSLELSIQVYSS